MPKAVATSGGEKVLVEMVGRRVHLFAPSPIKIDLPGIVRTIPDLMLKAERIAVFYDGCYWHECPEHYPHSRKGAAISKDRRVTARLIELGWRVLRIWEHEDLDTALERVVELVKDRRAEIAPERTAHVAAHDTNAWCEECESWPHKPWPVGLRGTCLRCGADADEHDIEPI